MPLRHAALVSVWGIAGRLDDQHDALRGGKGPALSLIGRSGSPFSQGGPGRPGRWIDSAASLRSGGDWLDLSKRRSGAA
jgi:hypothetical protein